MPCFIIDEVHMLTNQAFNALLKLLEEPPERVHFIFATTEPHKVIETIRSRCQRHDFRRIPSRQIVDALNQLHPGGYQHGGGRFTGGGRSSRWWDARCFVSP